MTPSDEAISLAMIDAGSGLLSAQDQKVDKTRMILIVFNLTNGEMLKVIAIETFIYPSAVEIINGTYAFIYGRDYNNYVAFIKVNLVSGEVM